MSPFQTEDLAAGDYVDLTGPDFGCLSLDVAGSLKLTNWLDTREITATTTAGDPAQFNKLFVVASGPERLRVVLVPLDEPLVYLVDAESGSFQVVLEVTRMEDRAYRDPMRVVAQRQDRLVFGWELGLFALDSTLTVAWVRDFGSAKWGTKVEGVESDEILLGRLYPEAAVPKHQAVSISDGSVREYQ